MLTSTMTRFVLLLIFVTSCAPVYVPNIRNSPMFTDGGEVQGSASMGNGFEAQSAVSVTKHIGIMANYMYINRTGNDDNDDTNDWLRHRLIEGAVGYFVNDGNMFFEIYGGYGQGEGQSYHEFSVFGTSENKTTGRYNKYFIQPGIGMNKKTFDFSIVPRVSMVDFTTLRTESTSVNIDEEPIIFFEPSFVGRVNMANNNVFFTFQAGLSYSVTGDRYFDHRPFQMSTGLGFRLGGRGMKSATTPKPSRE